MPFRWNTCSVQALISLLGQETSSAASTSGTPWWHGQNLDSSGWKSGKREMTSLITFWTGSKPTVCKMDRGIAVLERMCWNGGGIMGMCSQERESALPFEMSLLHNCRNQEQTIFTWQNQLLSIQAVPFWPWRCIQCFSVTVYFKMRSCSILKM